MNRNNYKIIRGIATFINQSVLSFICLIVLLCNSNSAFSQSCANYTATRTTGITYNDISATGNAFPVWRNVSGSFTNDDNRSNSTNIGFDFWYLGIRYTSFSVSTNGFIDFSASAADGTGGGAYGYVNSQFSNKTTGTYLAITPFYEDMTTNQANADPLAADIKYLLSGAAPNRTLTVAWSEMSRYGEATASNLNFQVVLHESTGIIDLIYGTMTFGSASWTYTAGINNSSIATTTPTAVELKCQQTANTATFSNAKKDNLAAAPATNSKITLTPPTIIASPTGLSFTAVAKTGMTLNWACAAGNEVGFVIYNSTDNVNFSFVTQVAANSVSAVIAGLYPSTTYYWQVYAVTDGDLSTALTGTQTTLPALRIISIITGNWNAAGTWDCTCIPTAGDSVIIANATTVTLDAAANGVCYSLTVGQGTSGQLTIGSSASARTLTVSKDVRVLAGATMTTSVTAPASAHSLVMGGNLTNNGIFDLAPSATRIMNVTFNKNGNQTISGAGATTNFNNITLNMGASNANVLNVASTNFTVLPTNFLTITNGTFKISTATAAITPFTGAYSIPATGGLWLNNAGTTISTGNTVSLFGYLRVTAGTLNIGNAADENITSSGGTLTIDGGTVNVAGRLDRPAASADLIFFTMSSGVLTLATVGSTTATFAPFQIDQVGSTFNMSGGTIIIRRPGAGNLGFLNIGATPSVTGGTLQMGDASTPAAQTMLLNSDVPIYNLVVSNGVPVTAQLSTNSLIVKNNVTINSGTLNANALDITLGGNWSNSGTYTPSTGTVTFNGSTAAQTIGGSVATTFKNLTINNSFVTADQITLNAAVTVNGALTLTDGIVNPNANILLLAAGATTTIGSVSSYIDGPMSYSINSAAATTLNYPIGNASDYRPVSLALKYSAATAHTYTAQLYDADANALGFALPATLNLVSHAHYYKISASVGSPVLNLTSANLTINYNTINGYYDGVTDKANLGIAKSTGLVSPWIDISTGAGGTANGAGSITSAAFTSFSYFSLANKNAGSNPLPIELLSFDAKPNGSDVDLKWVTASEKNNDYFTIEKTKDGSNFEQVEKVNGAGNSTSVLNYSTKDAHPYEGVSYYRLKQTDYNGDYTYSNLVSVEFKYNPEFSFNVYPNPNDGSSINLALNAAKGDEVLVVVYDVTGRESYSHVIVVEDNGEQVYAIDPSQKLSPGVYLITGTTNQSIYSKKLIVK